MFIGREKELRALNERYEEDSFQLFILYGRRRVGKTTLLIEFCRDKEAIFYSAEKSFAENIKDMLLKVTAYLYEEPLLLLRQEVQEPGIYSAVIEAIASDAVRSSVIAVRTGEEQAKCLKYINTLCELGILYKETPFGEKDSARRTIYGVSDFMFRFWYRYVFPDRTLLETGASEAVWKRRIVPDYNHYMGLVFEKVCREYLLRRNSLGELPILFTSIGRWWGTDPVQHRQTEIDLVARDGNDYLLCECKWRNEATGLSVLSELRRKADVYNRSRGKTWFYLFSKSGFTQAVAEESRRDDTVVLVDLEELVHGE